MLCLPEFDTYHILPEYASNPDTPRNRLALHLLKHRAITAMEWRVLNCRIVNKDNSDKLLQFQMGNYGKKAAGAKKDISQMSSKELLDFYMKATAAVGIKVDPASFTKTQPSRDESCQTHK